MSQTFPISVGDTGPPVEELLKKGDGTPLNTIVSVRFLLYSASGVLVLDQPGVVVDQPTGDVRYDWGAADTTTLGGGTFFRRWRCVLTDGTTVTVPDGLDGYPVIITDPASSAPSVGRLVCSPWCSPLDVVKCGACASGAFDPSFLLEQIDIASDILFLLGGLQYPGLCTDTLRPQRDGCAGFPHIGQVQADLSRHHYNDYATDRNPDGLWEILLPVYPIVSITQVKVDGVVVPPSSFRILDDRWLARVDGLAWPSSQDLSKDSTEVGTFEVIPVFGAVPPPAGRAAAAAYACQIAKACSADSSCSLPARTQQVVRQGLSARTLDPDDYIENGKTGVNEADRFIRAINPNRLQERPSILSPDMNWPAHRMR